jgi:hypothetical protein
MPFYAEGVKARSAKRRARRDVVVKSKCSEAAQ